MKIVANVITAFRIVFSLILLFLPVFSPWFYGFYIAAGFSDMIDGTIARKTGTESAFGAKLDSLADFIFVVSASFKIFPAIKLSSIIWIWTGVIAAVKLCAAILLFKQRQAATFHTVANKITGFLLFCWPFTFSALNPNCSAVPVCVAATFAAIQELVMIFNWRR